MTDSINFYKTLPVITEFAKVPDSNLHTDVPDDWYIVITDVIGSTKAISAGKYKEVNMVGAACIAAVVNVNKEIEIPFIFGGDGATFAIPMQIKDKVLLSLAGARKMAIESFSLELRVGILSVGDLKKNNAWVRIGKYQMSQHIFQPAFSGRGWDLSERLVKDPSKSHLHVLPANAPVGEADFSGLECRWNGIPSIHDCKLALLIVSKSEDASKHTDIYQEAISFIEKTLGSLEQAHPIRQDLLKLNTTPGKFKIEAAIRTFGKSKLAQLTYQFLTAAACNLGNIFFKRKIDAGGVKWSEYLGDFVNNCDFKKFDGMLRMVIDCTNSQKAEIEQFLEGMRKKYQISYGMHASPQAIVTCLISSYNGYHTHFIDGSDGGYAMAAVQLKAQLKEGKL